MEKKMNIHLWMYKVDDAISLMNIRVDDVSFDNFSPTAWLMMCINLKGLEYVKEKKIAHFLDFACSMQLTHKNEPMYPTTMHFYDETRNAIYEGAENFIELRMKEVDELVDNRTLKYL